MGKLTCPVLRGRDGGNTILLLDGKTQTALEYAYQHQQEYQAILWTLADTRESLITGYGSIAQLLNLPEKDEQDQTRMVEAVKRWFVTSTGWLLILDNADDLAVVREFLPPTFGSHILLTTRAQAMGRLAHHIEVETMPQKIGALFLLRRAGLITPHASLQDAIDADVVTARAICEELGGLPLALDQAGAYIEEVQCSLQDYQQRYRTCRAHLLQRRGGVVVDHPDSVATTWSLSFERVKQKSPIAVDLLRLCAFLYPDAIPIEVVAEGIAHLNSPFAPAAENDIVLDNAIAALVSYSLIRCHRSEKTLSVHRLVQAILKGSMNDNMRHLWVERSVHATSNMFPHTQFLVPELLLGGPTSDIDAMKIVAMSPKWDDASFMTQRKYERYLPHALVGAGLIEQEQVNSLEAVHLLRQAGHYLRLCARYAEAEQLYRQILTIGKKRFGETHPDISHSLNDLAMLYHDMGKYEEAGLLYKRVFSIDKEHLREDHPSTGSSLNNLAEIYRAQGKYEEAEPLYKQALSINEQRLGEDHPHTAQSLCNLAGLYYGQGKYEQAELLCRRALSIREQQLGGDHPDTAQSLNNLALLYDSQGKYEEAEPLYRRVLSIDERQLGSDHPSMAASLGNLALLYYNQGKYEEAEPLYRRALFIDEKAYGSEHPHVATDLNNLAELYRVQDKDEEAELLFYRALAIIEKRLGNMHPGAAFCLNNLALLYHNQGKYEEAKQLHERALSIREQQLGMDHPNTAQSLNNLAALYYSQRMHAKAVLLYKRALAIHEQAFGSDHPQTQIIRASYIDVLSKLDTNSTQS